MWDTLFKIGAALLIGGLAVYTIKGIIDKRKIQEAMRDKDIQEGVIESVNRSAKRVKLKDVRRGSSLEIEGDGISSEIHEGMRISA